MIVIEVPVPTFNMQQREEKGTTKAASNAVMECGEAEAMRVWKLKRNELLGDVLFRSMSARCGNV